MHFPFFSYIYWKKLREAPLKQLFQRAAAAACRRPASWQAGRLRHRLTGSRLPWSMGTRRRLGNLVVHLHSKGSSEDSGGTERHWRRVQRRQWRVGDRCVLTPNAEELAELCLAYGTPRTAGVPSAGWAGELVTVERGNPVAWCVFDGQQGQPHPFPLEAAGRWEKASENGGSDEQEDEAEAEDALVEEQVAALELEEEIPIVVMDAMLPGQTSMFFASDDAHKAMLARCLESENRSFGMIGVDGKTDKPLLTGTEVEITNLEVMQTPDGQQVRAARRKPVPLHAKCQCHAQT